MNLKDKTPAGMLTMTVLALVLGGCQKHDFPQYPPDYREYAYVTTATAAP